jgi:superfamily II DNA or RNA helicase
MEHRKLKAHYRSGTDDLRADFFLPSISSSTHYRRGAGYFTSGALSSWANSLESLVERGPGFIQLLTSPQLRDKDKDALAAAVGAERTRLLQQCSDSLVLEACGEQRSSNFDGSTVLAWLVARGIVIIRFAFAEHSDSSGGDYHEKIGILDFPNGDQVAFNGSANESDRGHSSSYENLDVFRSWVEGDVERVETKVAQFDEAFGKSAPGLKVLDLSKEALERVQAYSSRNPPGARASVSGSVEVTEPDGRWRHQEEAIDAFLARKRGVLEMATGTGKTRTSLRIIQRLIADDAIDSVIVAADGNDLLNQWRLQLVPLASKLESPMSVFKHYESHHELELYRGDAAGSVLLMSRRKLHQVLKRHPSLKRLLLIHDEVHQLGSPGNRDNLAGLSDQIEWRLGLSATPDREYDEEGTDFIKQHVGEVIYEFDLAKAIKRKVLCPFDYEPLEYTPSVLDKQKVKKVHAQKAERQKSGDPMSDQEVATKIARVYKESEEKIEPFKSFISKNPTVLERCIIFVETKAYGEKIFEIVHGVHEAFHTYYDDDKKSVLEKFATGDLECLITCRRLSEGIDIRNLRNVILFSSAKSKLETIQRIGRCIRWDPDNPEKVASVLDFIRTGGGSPNSDTERSEWLSSLAQIRPKE